MPDRENKSEYDPFLQFCRITPENWLKPDRKNYVPVGFTNEQWIAMFLRHRLDASVPRGVIQVFEIARGAMIYSWFFYPLASLGIEQCTRIAEFAAREKCSALQISVTNFSECISKLHAAGYISDRDEPRWQALRRLRNDFSHLDGLTLLDPGQAVSTLGTMTELINSLFTSRAKTPMPESFQVHVDKATFLEVGRVFKRVYRPGGASNVIITLKNGMLRIEFYGGGTELKCESPWEVSLEMTAKSFAGITTEYRNDKNISGTIPLTFRPKLGEFATPKAGARAKYSLPAK